MFTIQLFPDPTVLIQLGPLLIRYYALAYIFGLVLGWRMLRVLVRREPVVATPLQADDFLTWVTLGVVLGGRLGYVVFYQPGAFLAEPWKIFAVWQGGMAFHGGMLGVAIATTWFCRREGISLLGFADRIAVVSPIGLGFGRVANFINGELWGRAAPDWLPWAMAFPGAEILFPSAGSVLRHPSQIYQALMEGLCLFVLLWALSRRGAIVARAGLLTGIFLAGYAIARVIGESFRQPDLFLGYWGDFFPKWFLGFLNDIVPESFLGELLGGATMGQLLSLPMLAVGLWLIRRAWR